MTHRPRRAVMGASVALAAALIVATSRMNAWLAGVLWLTAFALLAYGIRSLAWKRSRQLVLSAAFFVLGFMWWNHMARQPRLRVEAAQLRTLPSSAQPGLVELMVRNAGDRPAEMVVFSAAYVGQPFRSAQELEAAGVEADLRQRLQQAAPSPATGRTLIKAGQTTLVDVAVPFSERVWRFGQGDMTLLVAARVEFRDRVFQRERVFCQFANPKTGEWVSCPFLNK